MRWNIPTMKWKFLTLLAFVYVQGTLAEEPRLFTIPADPEFTVHRGNPTVFVCKAEVPDPTLITDLKWISPEGLEIGVSDRIFTEISYLRSAKPQNRLEIKSVQETDAGNYTCRLTYGLKKLHRSINLSVEVSIKWIDVPAEQRAVLGKEYNVKCIVKAEAHDVVKVHWLKDGVDVTKKIYQSQYLPQGNGLLIRNVSREDAGIFTCRAKVQLTADFSEKQITLKIIVPPKFKNVIEDIESIEGMSARLDCEAEGEPTPTYEFLDANGEPIIGRPGFVINPNTGILVIEEVKIENAGEYKCRALNDGGCIEAVWRIRVITNTTKNEMWTWSQRPVNLTCRASSIPNATINWWNSRYNALIDENDTRYRIYNEDGESTLLVTPENDSFYGEYRCLAENKHVKAEHVITLKKAHVPQPPTQATFQTETATTITFNIVGPQNTGGINLTYYAVQYRKKNEEWIDENPSKEWPIGSPYILENLEPQTTYVFRFFAKNLVGLSTYGEQTQRTMPKRAAPEKPDILPTPIGGSIETTEQQSMDYFNWSDIGIWEGVIITVAVVAAVAVFAIIVDVILCLTLHTGLIARCHYGAETTPNQPEETETTPMRMSTLQYESEQRETTAMVNGNNEIPLNPVTPVSSSEVPEASVES